MNSIDEVETCYFYLFKVESTDSASFHPVSILSHDSIFQLAGSLGLGAGGGLRRVEGRWGYWRIKSHDAPLLIIKKFNINSNITILKKFQKKLF